MIPRHSIKFNTHRDAEFWHTLRNRVQQYFKDQNLDRHGNYILYIKTAVVFMVFVGGYICILSNGNGVVAALMGYVLVGLGQAGIGLCVMHDAMHGAFSGNRRINNLMQYSMTLIGGNRTTWKIQHNIRHHSFTNIYQLDEDIADKPFLRLSPYGKIGPWHAFQHYYAWFLYCMSVLAWLYKKDFVQLQQYKRDGMPQKMGYNHSATFVRMTISKILFIASLTVLPVWAGIPLWIALIGFLLAHMLSGVIISAVFQLAHVVECTEHDHLPEGDIMESSWAVQQLRTTANFAADNPLVTWLTGGLNHQVEHHLFPAISHVHYPALSAIVRETAAQYNLPYHSHHRFFEAVASHIRTLKHFGRPINRV